MASSHKRVPKTRAQRAMGPRLPLDPRQASSTANSKGFSTANSSTVKIENLSQQTSDEDLLDRLQHFDDLISSVRVVECPSSPANFAYVNCTDGETALSVIAEVDRKMLLHSNLLTAKLKEGGRAKRKHLAYQEIPRPPSRNIAAVKVLIEEGAFLTGEQLDGYFSDYGELSSPCKIQLGHPNYAYVNFKDPSATTTVRAESKHMVQGVSVTAVSFKLPQEVGRGSNSRGGDLEFVTLKFFCDPLVVKYVKEDVDRHLMERRESGVQITPQRGEVCVYAEKSTSGWIGDLVKGSVAQHVADIRSVEESLDCYYLPILADQEMQRKFDAMQVPFEVRVQQHSHAGTESVTLAELSQAYLKCEGKSVTADGLKRYLSPSKKTTTHYEWFWQDETGFVPYDASISKKLDRAFSSGLTIVEAIGRFDYKINPVSKEQVNTRTGKVRRLRRKAVIVAESRHICIQIRAPSRHLDEVKRELVKEMDATVVNTSYSVPHFSPNTDTVDHLLGVARQGFVSADRAGVNRIVLKGVQSVVSNTELSLKEEVLKLRLAQTESSKQSVPSLWDPQDDKCLMVGVGKRSVEWNEIERDMTEPGFRVKIIRIERIQNLWLWEIYNSSRKRMSDKNSGTISEQKLFHGTRTTPPKKIYNSEQGFDNRLSSRGLWGEGAYFAVKASYSNRYAYTSSDGHSQIFLVQVLTGITYKCPQNRDLKAPPKKADYPMPHAVSKGAMFEDERYDSVSGDTNGSEIFVIYEHGKVYPAYLITYNHV